MRNTYSGFLGSSLLCSRCLCLGSSGLGLWCSLRLRGGGLLWGSGLLYDRCLLGGWGLSLRGSSLLWGSGLCGRFGSRLCLLLGELGSTRWT
jgi:hypothetical protein